MIANAATPPLWAPPREWLVCFSHLRWKFVYQRPQHLLTRAARRYRVSYIEEPVFEAGVTAHLHLELQESGVELLTPVLPRGLKEPDVRTILEGLIEELVAGRLVAVAWYYTPMAIEFTDRLTPDLVVYDCMDELSAFRGASERLVQNERRLLERADLVFTGGRSLFEAKRELHDAVFAFPSSVDRDHFAQARQVLPEPPEQATIARPRIGFFGVIDERMDLPLVKGLAELRPDLQFVLIGPTAKIDPQSLPKADNLHWLGPRDYADLPAFMAGWDGAFMPFAINEATRFISPTKTPEFLAAGLPVVCTAVADVVRPYGETGLVAIAPTAAEMSEAITRSLAQPRNDWLKRVDVYLAGMSWDRTWREMSAHIAQPLTAEAPARRHAPGGRSAEGQA